MGARVTIYSLDGTELATAIIFSNDGTFSIALPWPQTNGEVLIVTLTNAGKTSLPTTVQAPDTTPPEAPNSLAISANGSRLTGRDEPAALARALSEGILL